MYIAIAMKWMMVTLLFVSMVWAQCPSYDEPGPWGFSYRTEDIPGEDETMNNSRIYYPSINDTIPNGCAPCPIIVFGHGWQIGISNYYSYGEHFASHGFVVVLPAYSNPLFTPNHAWRARLMIGAGRWTADLNDNAGDVFHGKLDPDNWSFVGHSLGGSLSMLAGDRYVNFADSSIHLGDTLKAIVVYGSPESDPETDQSNVTTPKMILSGTNDGVVGWEDTYSAFWAGSPEPGVFILIEGGNHCQFCDASGLCDWTDGSATISREEQRRIARLHTTPFLLRYQMDDDSPCNLLYTYGDSVLSGSWIDSAEVNATELSLVEAGNEERKLSGHSVLQSGETLYFSDDIEGGEVFDILGKKIDDIPAGRNHWKPTEGLPQGVYFVRIRSNDEVAVIRTVIVR